MRARNEVRPTANGRANTQASIFEDIIASMSESDLRFLGSRLATYIDRKPAPELMNQVAAAEYLGISVDSLRGLERSDALRRVRITGFSHPVYRKLDLDAFVRQLERVR